MSAREKIQDKLVAFLTNAKDLKGNTLFDAPYGIIPGLQAFGKGQMRVIAFGVSRYLDATIKILSPDNIVIQGQGGLAYKVEGSFKSVDEVIQHFISSFDYGNFS